RLFKTTPLKIEVYPGEPPTSQGRIHLLLHTVERKPNQLLTQATITRFRQYTAGIVSVQNEDQLPDPRSVPAGTLAVPSASGRGIYVRSNTSLAWVDPLIEAWRTPTFSNGFGSFTGDPVRYRVTPLGLQFKGRLRTNEATSLRHLISRLSVSPTSSYRQKSATSHASTMLDLTLETDGRLSFGGTTPSSTPTWASLDNVIVPLD